MGRRGALVGLHGAVLLFGFAGLFGKWLLLPPVWIVLGRTVVAAAALGVFRATQRDPLPFDARLIANGAVLALHWVAFFTAIQMSSVAIGLLGFASFPLFVLLLERALLGRRWSPREAVVAALVTLGLILLVPEFSLARPATDVAFWQYLWAAVALLPFAVATGTLPEIGYREIALVLVLGLVCTAVAHTLFINCLRTLTAHTASVIVALEPVYGIMLALVLLGEVPGWRTLVGAVLIVGAAIYATWRGNVAIQ